MIGTTLDRHKAVARLGQRVGLANRFAGMGRRNVAVPKQPYGPAAPSATIRASSP